MNSPTRRRLLRAVAGGVGVAGVAGCVEAERSDEPADQSATNDSQEPAADERTDGAGESPPTASVETVAADCGVPTPDALGVEVGQGSVTVGGQLGAPTPAHEAAVADLSLADGVLSVGVEAAPSGEADRSDCNGVLTYEAVVQTGDQNIREVLVEHGHASAVGRFWTRPGNSDPAVQSTRLVATEANCGSPSDARVETTVADDEIRVTGAQPAPNPCHEATPGRATVTDGTLLVPIGARSTLDPGQSCVQCRGLVTYELVVEMTDADALSGVQVYHARPNGLL